MAILPNNADGEEFIITSLENDVLIIKNPGYGNEEVLIKYDARDINATKDVKDALKNSNLFLENQKIEIYFWMGYFYAHLWRRA